MGALIVVVSVIALSFYASDVEIHTIEDRYELVQEVESKSKTESTMAAVETMPEAIPTIVRVSGYGAFETKEDRKSEAKRLMVMRASKLDAYRNMAERIYGISVTGASDVRDFAVKDDRFVVAVDSVIRGARVVSITDHPDKGIETVIEILLPGDFEDCLNKVGNFRNGSSCLHALPQRSKLRSELLGDASTGASASQGSNHNRNMQNQYYLQ